ncbi:MAG: hypothetical protein CL920_23750 [Deltaproteobacteria bacterium]|nr:hypothetical protein [Deltaproteobacteria bacterium]
MWACLLYVGLPFVCGFAFCMWVCHPHPLGVFTPTPTMLTHCLCCAFGAWKSMCSTVATRRFRVNTRGAIRKPSHQTKTGSSQKKQPNRGRGFCFKDKTTHKTEHHHDDILSQQKQPHNR